MPATTVLVRAASRSKPTTRSGKPAPKAVTKSARPKKPVVPAAPPAPPTKAEMAAMDAKVLWRYYKSNPGDYVRNFMLEKYYPLLRHLAERIHARLPREVDVDDLISAGAFGLLDAINAYDLSRDTKFETFCPQRVRGAIMDHLRTLDWAPRNVRQRAALVGKARNALSQRLGRNPTEDEICQHLNIAGEERKRIIRDAAAVSISSLDREHKTDSGREFRELDVIRDRTQMSPAEERQVKDVKVLLSKGLTRAERLVVTLYYYEQMTMKEIGATLGLSESRVSQMHSLILARLKSQLQDRSDEFELD